RGRRGGGAGATAGGSGGAEAAAATGAGALAPFGVLEQPATPSAPSDPTAQTPARLRNASRRLHCDRSAASGALSLCRIRHTEVKKLWFVAG
ncbi:MAG TPA: hypothetical protein VFF43_24130, partial [Caldimonas sp.]|nr:hypothetical protein [Caldimonas sp.]